MNSRAAKNLALSKGKSIARMVVSGVKKVGKMYSNHHKATQEKINKYGTSSIFK